MRDRLTWVEFSRDFINAVSDWWEMKTFQTSLLGKSIFSQAFVGAFKHLREKQSSNDK